MRVVLWGTYDTGKPRIRLLSRGLRENGIELLECHRDVWGGIEDKSQLGAMQRLRRLLAWLFSYPLLVWRYLRLPRHDLVLCSYPGLLDVLVLRPFAWLRRTPLAWDVFISAYDTVVEDRRMLARWHPLARLLWLTEWLASRAADVLFMDTQAHARRLEQLLRLPANRCGAVWVGAESEHFSPAAPAAAGDDAAAIKAPLQVLFYGQFIPLHGIDCIVAAARELRDDDVEWTLIGHGQETGAIRALLAQQPLPKLRWVEWVPYPQLRQWIAAADVCLGIFGTSEKAASVIPNKVFQVLAAGRPLITRDSPAIRELLAHDPPCVRLVAAGDGQALADAVRAQLALHRAGATPACHSGLSRKIDAAAIGAQFRALIAAHLPLGTPDDH